MLGYWVQGFLVSFGLIVAIGAQNAFVLRQGLMGHNVFWVALTCFLCDALLISAGVFGLGVIGSTVPWFSLVLSLAGALFLLWYGFLAFRRSFLGGQVLEMSDENSPSILKSIGITLAITLLNPHVYLDTVALIGSVAVGFDVSQKRYFLMGAVSASFVWFFGLGFGARRLLPLFKKPRSWQILDALIGVIMWAIAGSLLWRVLFP